MDEYYGSHLQRRVYGARFMRLLKENKMMSVHTMVLKLGAGLSVVNQDQAFGASFFK
jgi:hypothetical protein